MPTINQLVKYGRFEKNHKSRQITPALEGCPQKRGVVQRVTVMKPKKPNSAERCVCRVKLTNGRTVTAYVPGDWGSNSGISEHKIVLLKGGGPPDLPGVKYRVVMGAGDMVGNKRCRDNIRKNKRSLYGVKKG
jgi:small subunit ribosomal protein S12